MHTRPTPTGHQHYLDVRLRHAPDTRFTDPIRALADLGNRLTQPIVEIVEQDEDGGGTVRVSVFSETEQPSPSEIAAINGLAAELTYADE